MLTHVVLFKLLDSGKDNVTAVVSKISSLQDKIPELCSLKVGADILHSERSYDLALIATFNSMADLEAYQVHPEHLKVLEYLLTVRESSIVVDFQS